MEAGALAGAAVIIHGRRLGIGFALDRVKMDDVGLLWTKTGNLGLTGAWGGGLSRVCRGSSRALTFRATAAMLWVGRRHLYTVWEELGFVASASDPRLRCAFCIWSRLLICWSR